MKPLVLTTARLRLRPFEPGDAARFLAIQSDWQVTRMLRMAPFPPDPVQVRAFVEGAASEWGAGTAYRFTIIGLDEVIGCADVDEIEGGWGDLGYWLAAAAWGQGLASEAAAAVRDFAFGILGLEGLKSGHAADNPASGRVLTKLGFAFVGEEFRWSKARNAPIAQRLYRLERDLNPEPAPRSPHLDRP